MEKTCKLLFLLLAAVATTALAVRTLDASSSSICGMTQDQMMTCRSAVATGSGDPPAPSGECCSALKGADLPCFCTFKNNRYLSLFGINATRAMELPSKCDPTLSLHC